MLPNPNNTENIIQINYAYKSPARQQNDNIGLTVQLRNGELISHARAVVNLVKHRRIASRITLCVPEPASNFEN